MSDKKSYDLHDSLGYWLTRVVRHMQRHFHTLLEEEGLTPGLWGVIGAIGGGRAQTPAEVADFAGVDRSAMTRKLDRLEADGYLRRRPSPEDRRSVLLELTAKGKRTYPRLARASQATNERFLHGLSATERNKLRTSLRTMLSNDDDDPLVSL